MAEWSCATGVGMAIVHGRPSGRWAAENNDSISAFPDERQAGHRRTGWDPIGHRMGGPEAAADDSGANAFSPLDAPFQLELAGPVVRIWCDDRNKHQTLTDGTPATLTAAQAEHRCGPRTSLWNSPGRGW